MFNIVFFISSKLFTNLPIYLPEPKWWWAASHFQPLADLNSLIPGEKKTAMCDPSQCSICPYNNNNNYNNKNVEKKIAMCDP